MNDMTTLALFVGNPTCVAEEEAPATDAGALDARPPIEPAGTPAAGTGEETAVVDVDAGVARSLSGPTGFPPASMGGPASLLSEVPSSRLPAQPVCRPKVFSEALAQVASQGVFEPERLRRVRSDIVVAARMTRSTFDQLPCDPSLLRPMIHRVLPARFRIRPKRWTSIKSTLARVLKMTGWLDTDDVLETPLADDWQSGCDRLPRSPQKAAFAHFARFCQRAGIAPACVTDETVEAYRDWKTHRTLELDVAHHLSTVRRLWNWIAKNHPSWPRRLLQPPRNPGHYGLRLDEVHPSLRAAIEACCASMARFTPLNPRQTRVYSRHTIRQARGILLRAAGVLVLKGADPGSLQGLRDVLHPAAIRAVLEEHAERLGKGKGWAPSSATVAITLKRMARISGALTDAELVEVERLCGMVKARPPRLTERAAERLAQFDEPRVLREFLRLATDCCAAADRILKDGRENRYPPEKKAARLHQKGLALAILLNQPLRREDLAELDLATDFRRDTTGRIVGLQIPGSKTKTGQAVEAWFDPPLIKRIERHLKVYRPILCDGKSTFLFPGRIDGHRAPSTMSAELKRFVQNQVGAEFNVHLVRHLTVTLLLEEDPLNMAVAQRLIGHVQLKTTERFYGQARTRAAHRKWADVLQHRIRRLERGIRP